jgi:hypothetical protein
VNRIILLLFGITLSFFSSCKAKATEENICAENVKIEYEWLNSNEQDRDHVRLKRYSRPYFTIYFLPKTIDSIIIYKNNELQTGMRISKIENGEIYNQAFSFGMTENKIPLIKIGFIEKNACLNIRLKRKYPIIYVLQDEKGKWLLRFSNFIHSDNLY